jgi:hypothetical protein
VRTDGVQVQPDARSRGLRWTPHTVQFQQVWVDAEVRNRATRSAGCATSAGSCSSASRAWCLVVLRERARDPLSYGRRARQPATKRRAASRFASTATTTSPHKGCRATAEAAMRKRRTSRPKPIR